MTGIPTRRLLVYVAAGLVVLVVGTLGLVSMRGGAASPADGVVVEAVGAAGWGSESATGVTDAAGAVVSSTTTTAQAPLIYVQVAGAVRRPGVYQVAPDARVFQAVLEAGGFTEEADQQAITLAARLSDGCRVYVPRAGESGAEPAVSPELAPGDTSGSAAGTISLNSATLDELDSLPGVGPAIAQQIIAYRESHGPFGSVDQLTEVPGIGPAKLEQIRPLIGL